ncbi:MAG TPA: FeoA family protein [Acidobacteriota bacterium]|nr:FeoA family protein [Acidobacteriota bacterium]
MAMATTRHNQQNPRPVRLSALATGQCGRVCGMDQDHPFCHRLRDLGFVPGSRVEVRRCSPLRDPVEYEVRNTRICLRRSESCCIFVLLDELEGRMAGDATYRNGNGNGNRNGSVRKDDV